uniref:Pif-1 n=1 Tax=Mamestra configurata nucleopolyhedrovirus TaxID=207830 RepID=A0A7G7Y833_NPVMC|nr:pif-1 [Mamestra configurata nucleopolyhedrovirus A]
MYLIVAAVLLIFIVVVLYNYVSLLTLAQEETIFPLERFNNVGVPLITPPTEIIIEGNEHECHKQLTPCQTHLDCDICREGLANCQYFDDKAIITITDAETNTEQTFTIEAGESYCLALDRERARSCNPHTGVWILAESPVGYSLLCSCLTPGLVTQLSLYNDCDVPVGCQPHGNIVSIHESPMRCACDVGFVPDFNVETQTPFCRSRRVRDMIEDTDAFPVAPCQRGYIRLDHTGLKPFYRTNIGIPELCVIDPCSVDPISGERHSGYLQTYRLNNEDYHFCVCPIADGLFGVYNDQLNMIRPSPRQVTNACLKPFNIHISSLRRIDYKFFWAHTDRTRSDEDVIAAVRESQLSSPRYRRMLFEYFTSHPDTSIPSDYRIFKLSTSYSLLFTLNSNGAIGQNLYTRYRAISIRTQEPCFFPGHEGRCITHNPHLCIRRHANFQVGSAEFWTNYWCYLSRDEGWLQIWSPPDRYRAEEFPVALRNRLLWAIDLNNRTNNTVNLVFSRTALPTHRDQVRDILKTYANYSVT